MHDRADPVSLERCLQQVSIGKIAFYERPPLYGPAMAVNEIVVGHRKVARLRQRLARVAADVTGAASDENGVGTHRGSLSGDWRARINSAPAAGYAEPSRKASGEGSVGTASILAKKMGRPGGTSPRSAQRDCAADADGG